MRDRVPVDAGEPGVVLEVLDAVLTQPHLGAANKPTFGKIKSTVMSLHLMIYAT